MEYIFAAYGLQAEDADRVRALGREAADADADPDSGEECGSDDSEGSWTDGGLN